MRVRSLRLVKPQDAKPGNLSRPRRWGRAFSFLLLASLVSPTLTGCSRPPEELPPPYSEELLAARLGLGAITDLAYEPGPSPQLAALASASGCLYLWSTAHGRCEAVLVPPGTRSPARGVCFTPAGDHILGVFEDGRTAVWDRRGTLVHTATQPGSRFTCMAPAGGLKVFIGCADGRLLLWDLAAAEPEQEVTAHPGGLTALTGGTEGLWSTGADGQVASWKPAGLALQGRSASTSRPVSLCISPDRAHLYVGFEDGAVRDFDPQALRERSPVVNLKGAVTSLTCLDNRVAAGTRERVLTWWTVGNEKAPTQLSSNHGAIACARFTPDGQHLAAGGSEGFVVLSPLSGKSPTNAFPTEMGQPRQLLRAVWSPDNRYIASVGTGSAVAFWDVRSRALDHLIADPDSKGNLQALAFAPGRSLLATAGEDGYVRLYNAEGKRIGLGLQGSQVNDVIFSKDGRLLASAGWDRTITLWRVSPDAEQGALQPLRVLRGHSNGISSLSLSADGRELASASWDQSVRLWDVETGSELRRLLGLAGPVFSCALAPSTEPTLVAGGWHGQAWSWDAHTGNLMTQGNPHKDVVWTTSFSPDGSVIATGSADRRVSFLHASTRRPVLDRAGAPRVLQGFHGGVRSIAWSTDRAWLAIGTSTGELMVLKTPEEVWTQPAP